MKCLAHTVAAVVVLLLQSLGWNVPGTARAALWSDFYHYRGDLIFQEEFNSFDTNRWQHIITAWRGGNDEFEYYTDRPENR